MQLQVSQLEPVYLLEYTLVMFTHCMADISAVRTYGGFKIDKIIPDQEEEEKNHQRTSSPCANSEGF